MQLVMRPCGHEELTSVGTAGENGVVEIPTEATDPFIAPTQVAVYVSAKAYVCLGDSDTPDATPPDRCVVQQATTEKSYVLTGIPDGNFAYVWIYAKASTITADVSFFG